MKGKEAEKDVERKKTKLTLDILTIGQMTLKCNRKEKKKNPSIYILISNLSIALIHPCLAHSTKGCGYMCVCVCVCVCWVGGRQACPFFFGKGGRVKKREGQMIMRDVLKLTETSIT